MSLAYVPHALIDTLAPFHILFGRAGDITYVSPFMRNLAGTVTPTVHLLRPFNTLLTHALLEELTGMVVFFELESAPGRVFKGQSIVFDGGVMLVGAPQIKSIAELDDFGLRFGDLPRHDVTGDLLLAIEASHISLRQAARSQQEAKTVREAQNWLLEAKNAAEEAARLKSDFISNVSHEMRTPLNAIVGFTHLLAQSALTPEQKRHVHGIELAGQKLSSIISDVLDFSETEKNRLHLQSVPFNIVNIFEGLCGIYCDRAAERGLEWRIDIAKGTPRHVMGDPWRIAQVLTQFLENALKFTESGFIFLLAESIAETAETVTLRFSVTDSGIGMDELDRAQLFEVFAQGDASSTRRRGGMGLGLALCKNLVTLMHGRLDVRSVKGQGSSFLFELTLPRVQEDLVQPIQLNMPASPAEPAPPAVAGVPPDVADSASAHDTVSALRRLLLEDDPGSVAFLEQHERTMRGVMGEQYPRLVSAVQRYDADAALALLP